MISPILKLRKEQKLTQREMGWLLGLDAAQISQYETGALRLSPRALQSLAELFGVEQEKLKGQIDRYYQGKRQETLRKMKEK